MFVQFVKSSVFVDAIRFQQKNYLYHECVLFLLKQFVKKLNIFV
jgi:hypothetical protein